MSLLPKIMTFPVLNNEDVSPPGWCKCKMKLIIDELHHCCHRPKYLLIISCVGFKQII